MYDGTLYVPSNGITALQPRSDGKAPDQIWQSGRLQPSTASPIVLGKHVFTVNRAGVLTAGSRETGEREWQLRLKGPFSSTPVAAGKHLYCVNEVGLLQAVDTTAKEGEITGKLDLNDQILATPAIANPSRPSGSHHSTCAVSSVPQARDEYPPAPPVVS